MRLRKHTYKLAGETRTCKTWTIVFTDHNDLEREFGAFADKAASGELGRKLERLVALRVAGEPPDTAMARWIETLSASMRKRLLRVGLLDSKKLAASKSLREHLDDFEAALRAKGNTEAHVKLVSGRARRVFKACKFKFHGDISASAVQRYLADLRESQGDAEGISAQTSNFYLQSCKQFCTWMKKDRRASETPLGHLSGLNVRLDRRHDRRALSVDECRRLIVAAEHGPVFRKITGPERGLLYLLSLETGMRSSELRSLRGRSFALDGGDPTVMIEACYVKAKREDRIPLRPQTAERLRDFLGGKLPGARAFAVPQKNDMARMMRGDLEAAREAWLKEAETPEERQRREGTTFLAYRDEAERVADYHSLRHTFISNLAASGVHPKTAQSLARHSTISLTLDRYTHLALGRQTEALEFLPDLTAPVGDGQALRATGTDDSSIPVSFPENGGKPCDSVGRNGLKEGRKGAKKAKGSQSQDTANRPFEGAEMAERGRFELPEPQWSSPVFETGPQKSEGDNKQGDTTTAPDNSPVSFPDFLENAPELRLVIDAWPGLPEAVRAGIVAMVKAASR